MNFQPISHDTLKEHLQKGKATFAFKKKDGTLRIAVGTLSQRFIPACDLPTGSTNKDGSPRKQSQQVVTYYDLEVNSWRSVSIHQEIFA